MILAIIWIVILAGIGGLILSKREILRRFYKEVVFEMGKVAWPTTNEVINSTIMVIVITVVLMVGVGIVDVIWANLVTLIYHH